MAEAMNISSPDYEMKAQLALPGNEVQLWRVDLNALGPHESRWEQMLSADELARAARFHFDKDRQHFTAARAILRMILGSYLNIKPTEVDFCYSQREKPSLAARYAESGITFNLSHSGGIALHGFARHMEVGVDVEFIRHDIEAESIARRFFSESERQQLLNLPVKERVHAFFRCWTRKEAYIKATGDGLSLPLSQFDVSLHPDDNDCLLATRPDSGEARRWLLREVPAGPDYVAALCAHGRTWKLTSWFEE